MSSTATVSSLLREGLDDALSYAEYRARIAASISETPLYDSESQRNHTRLNHQRMARIDKTIDLVVPEVDSIRFRRATAMLVLAEGWCGDAAHALPVLNLLAERLDNLGLGIVFRDRHSDLMDAFLTGTSRSIPKVVVLETESLRVRGVWGPRPTPAQAIFLAYRADPTKDNETYQLELQRWYNRDRTVHIQQELVEVLLRCAG